MVCRAVRRVLNKIIARETRRTVRETLFNKEPQETVYKNSGPMIKYIDNGQQGPVILLIPGINTPAHYYNNLSAKFATRGVRVLIPNLPDFGISNVGSSDTFRHSPEEIASVLRDFLKFINVPRVDVLLAHSAGMYPALKLASDNTNVFRSVALVCPPGMKPWRTVRPFWLFRGGSYCFSKPLLSSVMMIFFRWMHERFGMDCSDDMVKINIHTIGNIDFQKASECVDCIVANNTPVMLAFSTKDGYIENSAFYKTIGRWGLKKEDLWCYDDDGKLKAQGKNHLFVDYQKYAAGLCFARGGHSILIKYEDILVGSIMDMLHHVTNRNVNLHLNTQSYQHLLEQPIQLWA